MDSHYSKKYVELLEDALLDYCERYGPTDQALAALRIFPTTSKPEEPIEMPPRRNRLSLLAYLWRRSN